MEAGGTLKVSGINAIVHSERFTQGTASPVSFGNVAIKADRVEALGGGEISATNRFFGKGGDLSVNAREIVLDAVNILIPQQQVGVYRTHDAKQLPSALSQQPEQPVDGCASHKWPGWHTDGKRPRIP